MRKWFYVCISWAKAQQELQPSWGILACVENGAVNPKGIGSKWKTLPQKYKAMFLTGDQLYHASKGELAEGSTVFVATDEKDRNFFKPLQEHYDLCFLDDFKHLFEGLNENLYGMLDQLVASRGDKFFGTYYSTFTGFINRMRGYHADKAMLKGHEDGVIESYFFAPETRRYDMAKFKPPTPPYWAREFPLSWRDIDKGIEEIVSIGSKKKTKTQTTPAIM